MVIISDYHVRTNSEGKEFVAFTLEGDLEIVKSRRSGLHYLTARKCSVISTFTEERAKSLIGKEIPGTIIKENCAPYSYVVPETGEEILLEHTYRYVPNQVSVEEEVFV